MKSKMLGFATESQHPKPDHGINTILSCGKAMSKQADSSNDSRERFFRMIFFLCSVLESKFGKRLK